MTITEIRQLLESPYNQKEWKVFLQSHFTNGRLFGDAHTIELIDENISSKCYSLGNYEVDEYTKIGIFEVQLNDNIKLTRNRVGLRNLIKSITQQVAGAMVVFVQGDKWRFSYISKRKIRNIDTNLIEDKETNPKRYTYLFGKGEKALTAAQRFDKLIQKQQGNLNQFLTLNDFEEAFSVEKLSKEFFKNYKEIYEDFVEYITGYRYIKKGSKWSVSKTHEPHFDFHDIFKNDDKAVRDFFKRMLGRIVFLYFIQKKGWLAVPKDQNWDNGNPEYLYQLFKNAKYKELFYSDYLAPLFFETLNNSKSEDENADFRFPYLNGGLFDKTQDERYDKLALPSHIFNKLFDTFNNFNFTIYEDAPDEHTVAVDPEMLGHIFENLLEDNKDKGAFYTPKEIVHYMCKESLKAYLISQDDLKATDNVVARVALDKIIHQVDLDVDETKYAEKFAFKIIDKLKEVRTCDPAIGSGAFPIGLLQEIFNAQIFLMELSGFTKKISDAEIKKHIIEESIYGVDIDAGAVDIARLRFWLSLVVDEPKPQPLPNLSFKIVCANTLIPLGNTNTYNINQGTDIIEEITKIRESYFNANKDEKKDLERSFRNLQAKLWTSAKDWATKAESEYYKKISEFNPFVDKSCSWFDPWWMFGVSDGFDIVIGNPPYIKEATNKGAFEGFKKSKYYQGKMDLWYGFACVMLDNLKKNTGILTFIATNNWVTNAGASKFRSKITEDAQILQLIDFGNYKIFDSASIQTMVMLFKANSHLQDYDFDYRKIISNPVILDDITSLLNGVTNDHSQILTPTFNRETIKNKTFVFSEDSIDLILSSISLKSNFSIDGTTEIMSGIDVLQDFLNKDATEKIVHNVKTGQGVFVLTQSEIDELNLTNDERNLLRPYYTTENLQRFYGDQRNKYWIIYTDSTFKDPSRIKSYPNLKRHFDKFLPILTSDNKPYGLHRARNPYFFEGEKIFSVRKCASPAFTYTDFPCYVSRAFIVIKSNRINLKYLSALLNSKLIDFWLRYRGKMQGFQYQIDKTPLIELPLIKTDEERVFAFLVDYVLLQKKFQSDTTFFERLIDAMVYELYFPDKIKQGGAEVLKYLSNLPEIKPEQDEQNLKTIGKLQKELSDPKHDISAALLKLLTIEEINIIEGRK